MCVCAHLVCINLSLPTHNIPVPRKAQRNVSGEALQSSGGVDLQYPWKLRAKFYIVSETDHTSFFSLNLFDKQSFMLN